MDETSQNAVGSTPQEASRLRFGAFMLDFQRAELVRDDSDQWVACADDAFMIGRKGLEIHRAPSPVGVQLSSPSGRAHPTSIHRQARTSIAGWLPRLEA